MYKALILDAFQRAKTVKIQSFEKMISSREENVSAVLSINFYRASINASRTSIFCTETLHSTKSKVQVTISNSLKPAIPSIQSEYLLLRTGEEADGYDPLGFFLFDAELCQDDEPIFTFQEESKRLSDCGCVFRNTVCIQTLEGGFNLYSILESSVKLEWTTPPSLDIASKYSIVTMDDSGIAILYGKRTKSGDFNIHLAMLDRADGSVVYDTDTGVDFKDTFVYDDRHLNSLTLYNDFVFFVCEPAIGNRRLQIWSQKEVVKKEDIDLMDLFHLNDEDWGAVALVMADDILAISWLGENQCVLAMDLEGACIPSTAMINVPKPGVCWVFGRRHSTSSSFIDIGVRGSIKLAS